MKVVVGLRIRVPPPWTYTDLCVSQTIRRREVRRKHGGADDVGTSLMLGHPEEKLSMGQYFHQTMQPYFCPQLYINKLVHVLCRNFLGGWTNTMMFTAPRTAENALEHTAKTTANDQMNLSSIKVNWKTEDVHTVLPFPRFHTTLANAA